MKVWNGEDARKYSHVKRDGWHILAEVSLSGRIKYWTSGLRLIDLSFLPCHEQIFEKVPPGYELHCELWKPQKVASYISSGIANRDSDMRLGVYGVAGTTCKLLRCGDPLEKVAEHVEQDLGLEFIPFEVGMKGAEHIYVDAEGWVYNNGNLMDMVKYKPFRDATLQIVGIEAGKGKFEGLIGSLVVALRNGRIVCNVSGMTDAERAQLTGMHAEGSLIGKLCDVSYQYVNTKGKLRHGNFLRLREDKVIADTEV